MASAELRHARLLRPFPTRRLSETLFHVYADAHAIEQAVTALLVDPPTTPERWVFEVGHIQILLTSLSERCLAALPALGVMIDSADGDFQRAVSAMEAVLRGLQAAPEGRGGDEPERAA